MNTLTYDAAQIREISLLDGKYTILINSLGALSALRYGEPWRDLVGDNLVRAMVVEIERLREKENSNQ